MKDWLVHIKFTMNGYFLTAVFVVMYFGIFWVLASVWCTCVLLSTVFILSDTNVSWLTDIIILDVIHACAAGALLYASIHFTFLDRRYVSKKDTTIKLVLWFAACTISYITGLFK